MQKRSPEAFGRLGPRKNFINMQDLSVVNADDLFCLFVWAKEIHVSHILSAVHSISPNLKLQPFFRIRSCLGCFHAGSQTEAMQKCFQQLISEPETTLSRLSRAFKLKPKSRIEAHQETIILTWYWWPNRWTGLRKGVFWRVETPRINTSTIVVAAWRESIKAIDYS